MAEGCNLHFTNNDFKEIQDSLDKGLPSEQSQFASVILRETQKNNHKELMNALGEPEHSHYELLNKTLVKSFGEGKVSEEMEKELNPALHMILNDHKDPQGLFEKPPVERGPGSTSVDHPYEIICAAALINESKKLKTECVSSTGEELQIFKTDRLDLGQKSPSKNILSTKKKNTIESDILIQRDKFIPNIAPEIIGIDAKYTKDPVYRKKPGLERQLNGVKSALQDNDINEYHFLTNAIFSDEFKSMVDNVNKELIAEEAKINKELYDGIKSLTKEEKTTVDAVELASKLDFEKDRAKINELVKDRVPQIGYCEKVKFKSNR